MIVLLDEVQHLAPGSTYVFRRAGASSGHAERVVHSRLCTMSCSRASVNSAGHLTRPLGPPEPVIASTIARTAAASIRRL
jgi:hypothetical protein